jgi:histidine triad (HIT) family protein
MVAQSPPSTVYSGSMDSIFTKIIKREIPAEIIYEDAYTIVVPDKFPSMPGQLLVISKRQAPYAYDLSDEEYQALMQTTKRVARALDTALNTKRTCSIIEGFEVPHIHVRLYPCTTEALTLEPRHEASTDDLVALAERVRTALSIM